ncbi:putative 2-oxoglutarate-dependent dioxygenase JRG21 [Vitis vinifera]|uniref:Putative 2-oxoglutarate-dependent dioxygenase JRG21 n=1 Tax=Vitis vinifera TaxID=29760 RepID=A0A438HKG0_VITVI|nr:putative 2-oxoglutarate-dependent dioxygenase JRG21 [Vitis vinifera]
MMNCLQSWPEPIVRVQSLSDSGIHVLPDRYIRHPSDRPSFTPISTHANIPVIDLHSLLAARDARLRQATLDRISGACREWGFFQVAKQVYANSPATYEGYGSRLGVEKGAKLDWSDYFFLNYLPESARDENKWPTTPESCSLQHVGLVLGEADEL